jgi:hypothetical protein
MAETMEQFGNPSAVERIYDKLYFRDLLELARDVCLTAEYEVPVEDEEKSSEAALITTFGIRGLRAALEVSLGAEHVMIKTNDEAEKTESDEEAIPINALASLKAPQAFNFPLDRDTIREVTAFGAALSKESYRMLGRDVEAKVRAFKNATNDAEQITILEWMGKRTRQMYEKHKTDTVPGDEKEWYHPVRLSPKLGGVYPDNNFEPTCLGVSIMAYGFLSAADANVLHVGVMETQQQFFLLDATTSLSQVPLLAKMAGIELSDLTAERLDALEFMLAESFLNDRGYHAAVTVQLKSGAWYQFDPNYNNTFVVPGKGIEGEAAEIFIDRISKVNDTLHEFKKIAPGLELAHDFRIATPRQELLPIIDKTTILEDKSNEIATLLLEEDTESLCERLKALVCDSVFYAKSDDEGMQYVQDMYINNFMTIDKKESLIDKLFYDSLQKFFLWDETVEEVHARCKTDVEYLQRRVQDARLLPIIVMSLFVVEMYNASTEDALMNAALEFGLPDTRIGFAVLNDFATYCDDRLSAGFWLSQWPSLIPINENLSSSNRSLSQELLLYNNALVNRKRSLLYANTHVNISTFLQAVGEKTCQPTESRQENGKNQQR